MKKTLLLVSMFFLILSVAKVSAKCYVQCFFKVGTSTYYNYFGNYSFNQDTLINVGQPISIPIQYKYRRDGEACWDYILSYSWKKNGDSVSNAQIYTVTDTGLYEGAFYIYYYYSNSVHYGTQYVTLHVGYSEFTSVNEINSGSSWNLYPNPFTNIFSLSVNSTKPSHLSYQIYDCTGREIREVNKENVFGEVKLTEDFETMSKGIYFLRMQIGDALYEKKLIHF